MKLDRLGCVLVCSLGFLLGLVGCSSGPVTVRLIAPNTPQTEKAIVERKDSLVLLPVSVWETYRTEGATGVMLGPHVTTTDSLTEWVTRAAQLHLSARYDIRLESAVPTSGRACKITLRECYVGRVVDSASAQVVLKLDWYEDGVFIKTEILRGQRVGLVWFDAERELGSALNVALKNALAKIPL
jgi:hypothetical protein